MSNIVISEHSTELRYTNLRANLVDQVSSSGGLAGIDVSDDDNVNMCLFFSTRRIVISKVFKLPLNLLRSVKQKLVNARKQHQPISITRDEK